MKYRVPRTMSYERLPGCKEGRLRFAAVFGKKATVPITWENCERLAQRSLPGDWTVVGPKLFRLAEDRRRAKRLLFQVRPQHNSALFEDYWRMWSLDLARTFWRLYREALDAESSKPARRKA